MIFDGFFIHHLVHELNHELANARLEKIAQTSETSFVFSLYLKGERKYLQFSLDPNTFSVYLTKQSSPSDVQTQFLNTLKKHLEGAILKSVSQYQTDRVIIFDLIVYDFIDGPLPKRLIFEAMGKHSNLLLVKDNILIDSFKKMFFTEGRQLLPQAEFSFFPVNKKPLTEVTYEDIDSPNDLVDRYMGISPFLAKVMYERKINLLDIALQPTKNLDNGKLYVFDAFPEHANKQTYASISEMLDDRQPSKRKSVESHQLFIQKQLKKYSSKDEKIDRALQVANEKLMQKTWADLIYLSGLELSEKRSSLQSNDVEIFLDPTKTLNENAQAYYKIYQKAKRSIVHLHQQKNINDELIQLFHDFETYLDLSKEGGLKDFEFDLMPFGYKPAQKKNINKKQDTKPNITKIEAHDATFYVGKNNHQNEFLTHHFAKKEDYWFHVKSAPGSHVIVKAHHGMNEPILRLAAMLAAYFSKLRMSSSIPVDYTLVRHLKKIPGKPGYQVTYKNERTIYIDIDDEKLMSILKKV